MPKVSVIVPSYSRPELLKKTIESVLNQSFSDWELIIVDDNGKGSPSQLETAKLMDSFLNDRRIVYHVLEDNIGGSGARNVGWRMANGEYICFLDNDDEFYPNKLEFQLAILENSEFQMTVCRFDSFKNERRVRTSPILPKLENYLIPFSKGELNFASGSTLMVRKTLLEKIRGFDEVFRRKQDVELMIRLLSEEKLFIEDRVLVRLNIDDRTNIPKIKDFLKFQKLFNLKFKEIFEQFPIKDQIEIKQYNQIELAKVALWNSDVTAFSKVFFSKELHLKNKFHLLLDLCRKFITYHIK